MKTLKFKTNINCGNCVAQVKPLLDGSPNISHWGVETQSPDKILTVQGDQVAAEEVQKLVQEAGFVIKEELKADKEGKGFFGKLFG
jgi:copper chaperone